MLEELVLDVELVEVEVVGSRVVLVVVTGGAPPLIHAVVTIEPPTKPPEIPISLGSVS